MNLNKDIKTKMVPSYVYVYNKLYQDIVNGIYENGQLLQSENQLSKEYNISRNTLRQALAVLMQDGLIYKVQGKGTFVRKESQPLKKIYNFILEGKEKIITDVTMDYNINKPTEIAKNKLALEEGMQVFACDSNYFADSYVIAHSFAQIPMRFISSDKADLDNKDSLFQLVNRRIYEKAVKSKLTVQCILSGVLEGEYLKVKNETPLLYLEQILQDDEDNPIGRIKYYLRIEYYKININ